jgi:hypothetical protein
MWKTHKRTIKIEIKFKKKALESKHAKKHAFFIGIIHQASCPHFDPCYMRSLHFTYKTLCFYIYINPINFR